MFTLFHGMNESVTSYMVYETTVADFLYFSAMAPQAIFWKWMAQTVTENTKTSFLLCLHFVWCSLQFRMFSKV